MLDPKTLRNNLTEISAQLARRGYQLDIDSFQAMEAKRKELQVKTENLQSDRNKFSKAIGQEIRFRGDDDVWMFVNNELVIDIGGVHPSVERAVRLDRLKLTPGEIYPIDFFFAERHTSKSTFNITTSIKEAIVDNTDGVIITPLPIPELLEIESPSEGSQWYLPNNCNNPQLQVKGKTALEADFLPLELALIIDTSGSTAKIAVEDQTILDIERNAASALINLLSSESDTRLSLVSFAREVTLQSGLTDNWQQLIDKVDSLTESTGATHMAAAIEMALLSLESRRNNSQTAILLVTDGIPTLPIETGETQESGDRSATLDAAKLAKNADAMIFPIVIDPEEEQDRHLSTMPAVQAISGAPGQIQRIDIQNLSELSEILTHLAVRGVTNVGITNLTTGQKSTAKVDVNGNFESSIAMQAGDNDLLIFAHSGNEEKTIERKLTVPVANGTISSGTALSCD